MRNLLQIDEQRFWSTVERSGRIGVGRAGGLERVALTDSDGEMRNEFVQWCKEAGLGVTLFERVGKRLVLTDTGRGLLEHARAMAAAADAIALAAAGRSQDVSGRVVVSATDAFSAYYLPDVVAHIRRLAPQITIVVISTDSISDLRRREADIAIRHVRPTEPELIGRLVMQMTAHLYAAEAWIARNGMPQSLADLGKIDLLGFEPVERFVEHLAGAGMPVTANQCRIVSANAVVLWEMLRRGLGAGMMLSELAERTPGLVRILPEVPGTPVPVWLVTHREVRTSRRVRIVFDAIADHLGRLTASSPAQRAGRKQSKSSI